MEKLHTAWFKKSVNEGQKENVIVLKKDEKWKGAITVIKDTVAE